MAAHSYLVGLIGAGVGPSLSPPLHMREARLQGLEYLYRTIDIAEKGLEPSSIGDLVRHAQLLGYDALNITHPCKRLVVEHLDHIDPQAAELGAVNTVVFRDGAAIGYNTDCTGFAKGFARGLPGARTEDVVLLGAGGAGAAVAHALLSLGVEHLSIADVDAARSGALARELETRFPEARVESGDTDKIPAMLAGADGLVHCTPTGMAEHPGLPLDSQHLHPGLWVADIVYRPLDTALLSAARANGCRTIDGGFMAVYQAVDAFQLITGIAPDAERMLEHFRTLVA